jgi:hypothetical protein
MCVAAVKKSKEKKTANIDYNFGCGRNYYY